MTENLYKPHCIRTYSGLYVNVFEPTPEMFCVEDIAHALSNQCRFGGHMKQFYSVAEHSWQCSLFADPVDKLSALMHDASEAYLVDIPTPIKAGLSNYKEIEDRLMLLLAEKFRFQYPLNDAVKKVDETMLEWEWEKLVINGKTSYSPSMAKLVFLTEFNKIRRGL